MRRLKPQLTQLECIEELDSKRIRFQFQHPILSDDTRVYHVSAFDIFGNLTMNPTLLPYSGPEILIHNATSKCTMGIKDPEGRAVSDTCTQENYSDPNLQE